MPKMKKQEFIRQTPVNNKKQISCICRKTYNIGKEASAMIGCDLCNEWCQNNCIDFEPSFTHTVPLFICRHCIDSRFFYFVPFLTLKLHDVYGHQPISIKKSNKEFLRMPDNMKNTLKHHKFHSIYQENQTRKNIRSLRILSSKGISNKYLNCYMSAALQLLLGTSVSEMLPSLLESDTALNRNINFVKKNLDSVSSVPYSFSQYNRKSSNPKVPIMGQILSKVLNKDYIRKEILDSGEFLNRLIEKLYVDEIIENPFELIIAKLQQCSACNFIAGEIERSISMQVMVWNTDRTEAIRLQSLIWGIFACNLETKSDRKCSNCNSDK